MALILPRRTRLRSLSDEFARLVADGPADAGVPLVGVEHEFRLSIHDRAVDFRTLVHRIGLDVDGAAVDPADPNAYRGTWGGSITADGREAEVAIPPVPVGAGFSGAALGFAHAGRRRLVAGLPDGELAGFSTHLNVSVPRLLGERVARRYARTFAPALMLLLDSTASPGLLVRPRPGRLELGGEFVDGDRLRAALVFAAGSVLATIDAAGWRTPFARRPRSLRVDVEHAIDRFGWYVDRRAFGPDLYAEGRAAVLTTRRGARITAQAHLEECWAVARRALRGRAGDEEMGLVDEFVAGARALGVERPVAQATATAEDTGATPVVDHGFGAAAIRRQRPGMAVDPVVIGWDLVVLRAAATHAAAGSAATTYAALPRRSLARAVAALDRGELDEPLRRAIAASGNDRGRVLARASQARQPGLFSAMGAARDLVADERAPAVGERKERRREDEADRQPPRREDPTRLARGGGAVAVTHLARRGPGRPLAAVAAIAVIVLAGGAAALGRIGPFPASTGTPFAGVPGASAGASGAPNPSGALPSLAPSSAVPIGALTDFGGTWQFEASNPRVVSATGPHAGGTVVLAGDRYAFSAGGYYSEGPIDFVGSITLDCTPDRCRIDGVPSQLRVIGDQPVIVDVMSLTPLGSFAGRCGWTDIPDGGVVRVLATDGVAPTTIAFVAGTAGGVGAECESGGHVLAWDVTATRLTSAPGAG